MLRSAHQLGLVILSIIWKSLQVSHCHDGQINEWGSRVFGSQTTILITERQAQRYIEAGLRLVSNPEARQNGDGAAVCRFSFLNRAFKVDDNALSNQL